MYCKFHTYIHTYTLNLTQYITIRQHIGMTWTYILYIHTLHSYYIGIHTVHTYYTYIHMTHTVHTYMYIQYIHTYIHFIHTYIRSILNLKSTL